MVRHHSLEPEVIARPTPGDYHPAYERYVARVPDADVLATFEQQIDEVRSAFAGVPPARASYRYAPDKWTVRQLLGHVIDSERVFGYRILSVARGESAPLPGFDENEYAVTSPRDGSRLADLVDEFALVRRAHVPLVRGLDDAAWNRVGTANGNRIAARAMPYIMIGHVRHHLGVLASKYAIPAA
jgi:hypothetical protein